MFFSLFLFWKTLLNNIINNKKTWWSFFKIVGLQHPNLLKWNLTISGFLGITGIIFGSISEITIIWNPCKYLINFVRVLWWFFQICLTCSHNITVVIRNEKTASPYLNFLSPWLSYTMCVYLTFIAQYSNILYPS